MAGRRVKPLGLSKKHLTKEEKERRKAAEELFKFKNNNITIPSWLNDNLIALEEWNRVVKELKEKDLITNVDLSSLAIACDALSSYIEAKNIIDKNGISYETYDREGNKLIKANPDVRTQIQYANLYKSFCNEFGLTPSSRIKLAMPKQEEKPKNKFEKFLR